MKKLLSAATVTFLVLALAIGVHANGQLASQSLATRLEVLPYAAISFPGREGNHVLHWNLLQGKVGVYNTVEYLKGVSDIFSGTFVTAPCDEEFGGAELRIESNIDVNVELEFKEMTDWGFGPWINVPTFWEVRRGYDQPVGYAGFKLDLGDRPKSFVHHRTYGTNSYFIDGAVKIESISDVQAEYAYQGRLEITVSKK